MKIFLVITFSVLFQSLEAQIIPFTTNAEISDLIAKKSDYVVRFSLPAKYSYSDFSYDTALRIKFWSIFDCDYLIYKVNGQLYCVEIIAHCNDDCSNIIETKSLPTKYSNDSIYDEIVLNRFALMKEKILPYIYRDYVDSTKFRKLETSHSPYYSIAIYSESDTSYTSFNSFDFRERISDHFSVNLNYKVNSRTLTYKYFRILEAYFEQNSKQFQFQK